LVSLLASALGVVPVAGCGASPSANVQSPTAAEPAQTDEVPAGVKPLTWAPLGEPGSGGWMTGCRVSPHDPKRVLVSGDMLGIGLSTDTGDSWHSTFGLRSWEIGDLSWHPTQPNVVWAGTMSGPYLSEDGGQTWQERRNGFPPIGEYYYSAPIERVLFDPNDETRLLALGGSSRRWSSPGEPAWGALWESRDGGTSWSRLTTLTAQGGSGEDKAKGVNIVSGTFAAKSSKDLMVALDGQGVWLSRDGGRTFTKTNKGLPHGNVERVVAHPSDPNTFWAVFGNMVPEGKECIPGGVYKTADLGKTWTSINEGLSRRTHQDSNLCARYKGFAVAMSNPDVMYVGETAWNNGAIYGTRDGGKSWRVLAVRDNVGQDGLAEHRGAFRVATAYFSGLSATVMEVDPANPDVAWALGSEHILGTTDGGKTWQDRGNIKMGEGRWRGRGFSGLCSVSFRFDPNRKGRALLSAMDAGKLWESQDDLESWKYGGMEPWPWGGGKETTIAGDSAYATFGQFGSFHGIGRTTDGGKTWRTLHGEKHGLPENGAHAEVGGVYARPDQPPKVWVVIAGKLYASEDGGERFSPAGDASGLFTIAGDPNRPERFVIGSEGGVLETKDGGRAFSNIGGPKPSFRVTVDHLGRVVAIGYRIDQHAGVWRFDGKAWTRLFDDHHTSNVAVDPRDPRRLAVVTNDDPYHDVSRATGVWLSSDDGESFAQANDGLDVLRAHAVAFDPHSPRLVIGTQGRGYYLTYWPRGQAVQGTRRYVSTKADAEYASRPLSLIDNGDMERGEAVPDRWTEKWVGRGDVVVARDTEIKKRGSASLRIESRGGPAQGQIAQLVDVGSYRRVRVTGWLRSAGKVKVNVALQPFAADYKPISFMQAHYTADDSAWTRFDRSLELPADAARYGVVMLLEGDGKAWLDDVTVQPR
jgi:photosystem II stability/assembly factor-like uncharacterized protein